MKMCAGENVDFLYWDTVRRWSVYIKMKMYAGENIDFLYWDTVRIWSVYIKMKMCADENVCWWKCWFFILRYS